MTDRRASPVMRAGLLSRLEQAGAILDVDGPPAWATSDVIWIARLLEVTPLLIDHGLRRGDELWLLDRRLAPLDPSGFERWVSGVPRGRHQLITPTDILPGVEASMKTTGYEIQIWTPSRLSSLLGAMVFQELMENVNESHDHDVGSPVHMAPIQFEVPSNGKVVRRWRHPAQLWSINATQRSGSNHLENRTLHLLDRGGTDRQWLEESPELSSIEAPWTDEGLRFLSEQELVELVEEHLTERRVPDEDQDGVALLEEWVLSARPEMTCARLWLPMIDLEMNQSMLSMDLHTGITATVRTGDANP